MAEYIEREILLKKNFYSENCNSEENHWNDYAIKDIIRHIPAADVAPVVHGAWVPISDGAWAECSECGEACDVSDNGGMTAFELFCDCYKYCPTCGAKMDGGKSDE